MHLIPFGISAFGIQNDFASGLVSGELPVSPLVVSLSLFCLCLFLCLVFVVGSVAIQ